MLDNSTTHLFWFEMNEKVIKSTLLHVNKAKPIRTEIRLRSKISNFNLHRNKAKLKNLEFR